LLLQGLQHLLLCLVQPLQQQLLLLHHSVQQYSCLQPFLLLWAASWVGRALHLLLT
jgi:hypothetical protein